MDNSSTSNPVISSIDCSNAIITPATFTAGNMAVPYSDGNAERYNQGSPIASTGNTDITAMLQPGTLAFGNGSLI